MHWIELRFGSFTVYVYKYLRGCLASWKDAVFAGGQTGCIWFLTQRQDQHGDWPCHFPSWSRIVYDDSDTRLAQIKN